MHLLVNTSGGDAPGLNAVIRAIVLAASQRNWKVTGIKNGYEGLLLPPEKGLLPLTKKAVRGITHVGGTILGTRNKGHPFEYPVIKNGKTEMVDISDKVIKHFRKIGADALIAIGGDGSLKIANEFYKKGIPIVGVPKTIDNDVRGTYPSFGFDTAVMVATEAIDRLHTTAESHQRVMVVEVMGRYAGWIALYSGISGSADVILIPEIEYDIKKVCEKIQAREQRGIHFSIVVVAEGAIPKGGKRSLKPTIPGHMEILGGAAERVAKDIEQLTAKETRNV
ncbi:MAG: ATP-dependent 6-phosphofructokinase, partial [Bacteroidales bacterium]|nr:ATP-dependent 6-phosphofructokinase [Bacteroidales bacterium]